MPTHPATRQHWPWALAVVAVFLVVDHLQDLLRLSDPYIDLYRRFPFWVPEAGKSLLQIGLCTLAVRLLCANTCADAARQLGMTASVKHGLLFGLFAASPLYVGLALTTALPVVSDPAATTYLAGLSPLAEETLYRAFLCGLLCSRGGFPVWAALATQAAFFGWGHVGQGESLAESAGLLALISLGGFLFGWFFLRWNRNLWVPFFMHALMNLSWEIFQVSDNAIGGWYPFALQLSCLVLGILITLRWTKPIEPGAVSGATFSQLRAA